VRAITEEESSLFHDIRNASPEEIALVVTELDGKEVAVIVYVEDNPKSKEVELVPLAILMNNHLFKNLTDPMKGGTQTTVVVEKLRDEWKKFTTGGADDS
jgi:hypothetical protein